MATFVNRVRSFSPSNFRLVRTIADVESESADFINRLTDVPGIQATREKKWNADELTNLPTPSPVMFASGSAQALSW